MSKGLLLSGILFSVFLSGCLVDDTPCNYFRLTQKALYDNTWNVDSFHVFVYDSAINYTRDTTYLNDGTWKFVSLSPYNCNDTGTITFTQANGVVVGFSYSATYNYGPPNFGQLCIESNVGLDGFAAPYYLCLCFQVSGNTINVGTGQAYSCSVGSFFDNNRYWTFVLSKK